MSTQSGWGRRRFISRRRNLVKFCEVLENRVLLHAAAFHALPADLAALPMHDGHVHASDVLRVRPELVGKDLWAPETFNPNNSGNPSDWLYDPHFIEDDITRYTFPDGGNTTDGGTGSLPDLIPMGQNQGYLFPFLDQTEVPGRNLLRFSTAVGNMGAGPVNLFSASTGTPPPGTGLTSWINPDGTQNVVQGVYRNTGSNFTFDHYRQAGRMVWHSGHGHFHLEGYAHYRLLQNNGGVPGGVVLRNDGSEAVGEKIGFCLINILGSFQMPNGQNSSTLPGYGFSGQPQTTCGFVQGIHVGRADVYDAVYDGQWIDVTGVPNGSYFLEVTLDANNVVEELDEANNTIVVPVSLNASPPVGGIQPDRFEPNNTFAQATDLGVLGVQTQSGLSIHVTNGSDYFRFVAASSGNYQVRLNIADRDVNLFLYNDQQTLLTSSTSSQQGPTTETVNWSFVGGQTYYVRAQGFGSDINPNTSGVCANYALQVLVNPTVNAASTDPHANEVGNNSGLISLGRNGPTSSPLTVNFTVGGTATRGVDYDVYHDDVLVAGTSVIIGNEASDAPLEIRPIHDGQPEPPETVIITLGGGSTYVVGNSASATVTIGDSGPELTTTTQVWQTSPHKLIMNVARANAATISAADFAFLNLDTNQPVTPQSVVAAANGPDAIVTVTFNGVLPDGRYRATMLGAGIQNGQGEPGGSDFIYNFFVLTGDANHDGRVNLDDFNVLAANFGQSGRDGSTGDFTYDGIVNLDDFNVGDDDLVPPERRRFCRFLLEAAHAGTEDVGSAHRDRRRQQADGPVRTCPRNGRRLGSMHGGGSIFGTGERSAIRRCGRPPDISQVRG